MEINPWTNRFAILRDKEEIARRVEVFPGPFSFDPSNSADSLQILLDNHLKNLFVATPAIVDLICRMGDFMAAATLIRYKSRKDYINRLYHGEIPDGGRPICLTGLAGCGKTAVAGAFQRLFCDQPAVFIDEQHQKMPLHGVGSYRITHAESDIHVLRELCAAYKISHLARSTATELIKKLNQVSFRDGTPGIVIDELQHLSLSTSATARIMNLLLNCRQIGIPFVYVTNYSLLHLLRKRPQQDTDRVLGHILVLDTYPANSNNWRILVERTVEACGAQFLPSVARELQLLWGCTAGLPRYLTWILSIALRIAAKEGARVEARHIRSAAMDSHYFAAHETVKRLRSGKRTNPKSAGDSDLQCPPGLLQAASHFGADIAAQERSELVRNHIAQHNLTKPERAAVRSHARSKQPTTAEGLMSTHKDSERLWKRDEPGNECPA